MQHIQIPAGMGLEEFTLSYIEGHGRKGKFKKAEPAAEEASPMPDWEARRARRHRKVEYKEAEPEIPEAPILKPALPVKEEVAEKPFIPMMPPSAIPHQALPPLMPSPSEEVFAEPEMPAKPVSEEEIEDEAAEMDVEAMEPSEVMGDDEEDAVDGDEEDAVDGEEEDSGEEVSQKPLVRIPVETFMKIGYLSQTGQEKPPSKPKESGSDMLPVFLLTAGFIAVGAIIYVIKNPEEVFGDKG